MTNDINTLNGSLSELGETMADNLVSMGVVDASASDGLTTLAGRILDIEPSIGGLDLDTAVTISSSESSISLGSSIVLTSKLTASYDDETIVDVDLSGVLQNATLLFKNGNTTIGTAVTDVNGVATFTYTPPAIGTLSLKAIFAGTDNFNNCESSFINVTVVAPSYDDIVLTADDSILSYYDGDSTTLRAQLMDGSSTASVSGVTVEFFNGSTSLGTAQTDSTGMATKTYTSTGAGDVSLKAEADNGTLSSEISVADCVRYDSASSNRVSDYTVPSGLSMSWIADHYVVSSTSQSNRFIDFAEIGSDDFEFSALINTSNRNMGLSIYNDDTHLIGLYGVSSGTGFIFNTGGGYNYNRTSTTLTNNQWYKYTLIKNGSTYTGTIETLDGTVFGNWTQTVANFTKARLMSAWNVSMQIKQIKVKRL